uniref:IRF tryptophan pentad repeat domain-containing protein n=1 Tax=Anas platyrhynchos platyrhynchos TaxID=8840 RepID=A0A493T1T1_ANAPP
MAEPGSPMRLKEWLIAQIDSGRYPGLRWEDGRRTLFRIPWKHAAKQDYRQQQDAALFRVRTPPGHPPGIPDHTWFRTPRGSPCSPPLPAPRFCPPPGHPAQPRGLPRVGSPLPNPLPPSPSAR